MAKAKHNTPTLLKMAYIKSIRENKVYPKCCKDLMIENVQSHFHALGNALGCIELAARRAACHGLGDK